MVKFIVAAVLAVAFMGSLGVSPALACSGHHHHHHHHKAA
jgi:hypothetical protein